MRLAKIFVFLTILVNIVTLKDGHNWGGDFSQYILNAKNISDLAPYSSAIMLENPFHYPPGFPVLLAPWIKIFGVNFIALKFLNIIFWYASLLLLFPLLKRRLGDSFALLCCLFLSCSSLFFTFKQNVLSDIPFMFFLSAAFYLFMRYEDSDQGADVKGAQRYLFAFNMAAGYAMLIRSAGLILFVSTIFYLVCVRRRLKHAAGTGICLFLVVGLQFFTTGMGPGIFETALWDIQGFLAGIRIHYAQPIQSVCEIFIPGQTGLTQHVVVFLTKIAAFAAVWIYAASLFVVLVKLKRRTLSFLGCFVFVYIAALIIFSGFSIQSGMTRIMIPVIGLVLVILIESVLDISQKIKLLKGKKRSVEKFIQCVMCLIVILNIFNIACLYKFNDDVLYARENQELFAWVKKNIGMDEHYLFWKSRPLALMTGRVGAATFTRDPDTRINFVPRVKRLNIKYLILVKALDSALISNLEQTKYFAQAVWENAYYRIYRVKEADIRSN